MKKIVFAMAALFIGATALTSCRETEKETIIKEVETTTTTEENGGALQRAGEAVDNEVNKEIDDAINEIGDDN
jgi:hypothetical protein